MRSKENAQDYRYFPDPDLPPVIILDGKIKAAIDSLPEFMDAKEKRFVLEYHLSESAATILSSERKYADLFEATILEGVSSKVAANWFIEYVLKIIREEKADNSDTSISASELARLIGFVESRKVNRKDGLLILHQLINGKGPEDIEQYIVEKKLIVSSNVQELSRIIVTIKKLYLTIIEVKIRSLGF